MRAIFRFLSGIAVTLWLSGVALVYFIAPLYLLAIYPRIPSPPIGRYGLALVSPAIANFWYRLAICGVFIFLGLCIVWATLRGLQEAKSKERRRSGA